MSDECYRFLSIALASYNSLPNFISGKADDYYKKLVDNGFTEIDVFETISKDRMVSGDLVDFKAGLRLASNYKLQQQIK